MVFHEGLEPFVTTSRFLIASVIFVAGLILGFLLGRITERILRTFGLPEQVEGTAFERTAQGLGTSTVGVLAQLVALAVYLGASMAALHVAGLVNTQAVLPFLAGFLPKVFIAALAVIGGLVVGDKAGLLVSERLRGIKLPEVGFIPIVVKYSIFYIAALIALAQLDVATSALLIMLAAYAFGMVFLAGLAFKDLMAAGAAGIYVLLNQPYSIGDEIRIGERRGIVQEVDLFVTHIESETEEHIVPNREVFRSGVVRVRE